MKRRSKRRPSADTTKREKELIAMTTAAIRDVMKRKKVMKAELARRMGRTNAYVSQLLAGDRNLTLRTIADIAVALEVRPKVALTDSRR